MNEIIDKKNKLHYTQMSDGKWWAFPIREKETLTDNQRELSRKTLSYGKTFMIIIMTILFILIVFQF